MSTHQRSRLLVPEDLHRYGQRTYDPRLRAAAALFRGRVQDINPLTKNDSDANLVLRMAKNPMAIGTGGTVCL